MPIAAHRGSQPAQTTRLSALGFATTDKNTTNIAANDEIPNAMTEVAASGVVHDVATASNPPDASHHTSSDAAMANVKTEESSEPTSRVANTNIAENDGEDGDSEAETLIQSPEKKKNVVENAPKLQPTGSNNASKSTENGVSLSDSSKKSRKRKRDGTSEDNAGLSRGSSSSPLSSPNLQAQSRDSDSDVSDTPRSARSARLRRTAPKPESDTIDATTQSKTRKRRPSDIVPPGKHRARGSVSHIDGPTERRETRSATYPRQSSEERSPSPRPSSRREHRRGVSTQITTGDVERKKRGRPPNISTRRNISVDRAQTSDDEDDSSPAPRSRGNMDHSRENMSPAKPMQRVLKNRDKNGRTYLSRACNNDDLEKAKVCLEDRPEDINQPDNAGNTPLQIASLEGFTDVVRFLLESGAEVDTRNIDLDTPLIDAVENGHLAVVELLLKHGANPRLANAKGDEPFDLALPSVENYKVIRKLITEAKSQDWTKRRKSSDNNDGNGSSSRAASAASPRDSPPVIGPRSPPGLANRRRTGRSESTRNDLLWQQNTQENLERLASKGNVQGVATILNVLQKAEPASVIAAAKAGHEEVLQYLLAMGEADPDPEPQVDSSKYKPLYDTPMLVAIGRGNLDVVRLLVAQTGFNPTRKHKDRTYFEISAERKGESWQKEYDILKDAYDKHPAGNSKTKSPKKVRNAERSREKRTRRSESPPSSNLRKSSSPTVTHKSLPDKSPRSLRKDGKKDSLALGQRETRKSDLGKDDPNVAVVSDQEATVHDKRGHKHRRSQSDLPLPPNLEAEITQRRRRLISGKEHRRSQSGAGTTHSDGSTSEVEVKRERQTPGLKRNRSSVSPEPRDADAGRVMVKKRRTVLESSPEESRPAPAMTMPPALDAEMKDDVPQPQRASPTVRQHTRTRSQQVQESIVPEIVPTTEIAEAKEESMPSQEDSSEQDAPGEPDTLVDAAASRDEETSATGAPVADEEEAERLKQQEAEKAEQEKLAEAEAAQAQHEADEKAAVERELAERTAAEQAEAERLASEKAAAEKAEAEQRAAEEAEAKQKAEEAEAKRKAEEEAAARKKEQEDREEQKRRDLQRRQEEQIRQQHMEIERRRREALPAALATAALLLENGNPRAKSHDWLSHFLPLYTVRTEQLQPTQSPTAAHEEWIPNFQAATLLATKDLHLRNYTSIEKRPATEEERVRLWKVGRHMLSYDFVTDSFNTTIKRAIRIEEEQRPKFMNMSELFWIKVSISVLLFEVEHR